MDDDTQVRRALRRHLSLSGYAIVEATTGEQALFAISHHGPFEAVISDVDMPVCDGVSLLRKLRRLNDPHQWRFILHSSDLRGLFAHQVPVVQTKGCPVAVQAALSQLRLQSQNGTR